MKKIKIILVLLYLCQLSFSQVITEEPLISFNLSKYKPGEKHGSSTYTTENIRIFTGNTEKSYKDTLVQRYKDVDIQQSILNLYKKALNKRQSNRIIYADNISYINSYEPENLYNLSFSFSSLMGDYHQQYLNQLNNAFGLTTHLVQKKTEVLILKNVIVNGSTVKRVTTKRGSYSSGYTTEVGTEIKIKSDYINTSKLVECLESAVMVPVFDEMTDEMSLFIDLETKMESRNLDSWIALFKQNGIILEKETRVVEFIEIIKK